MNKILSSTESKIELSHNFPPFDTKEVLILNEWIKYPDELIIQYSLYIEGMHPNDGHVIMFTAKYYNQFNSIYLLIKILAQIFDSSTESNIENLEFNFEGYKQKHRVYE